MMERSTNLNDFLIFVPCCGVLILLVFAVAFVLLMARMSARE